MAKRKSFPDDGWAIWVTGDDTSTFYLNEWVTFDVLLGNLDDDEAYFMFRLPHKNLDEVFKPKIDVENAFVRLRELLTSPTGTRS